MKISEDHEAIHKIAFEFGKHAIDGQESTLASIRQRATAIVGLAGLAATFLGGEALKATVNSVGEQQISVSPLEWVAVSALVVNVSCAVWLLRSREWVFSMSPRLIVDQFAQGEKCTSLSNTYEVLSKFMEENFEINKSKLDKMFVLLNFSLLLVLIQILAWLGALAWGV